MKTTENKAVQENEEKRSHLIKNVPDSVWLEFRIMALENKTEMAETLRALLESHRELERLKEPKKSA